MLFEIIIGSKTFRFELTFTGVAVTFGSRKFCIGKVAKEESE